MFLSHFYQKFCVQFCVTSAMRCEILKSLIVIEILGRLTNHSLPHDDI